MSMKVIIAGFIGLIPSNVIKVFLFNKLLGYRISSGCKIGFNIICCEHIAMRPGARIGHFNIIYGVKSLIMDEESCINNRNIVKHLRLLHLKEKSLLRNANTLVRDPSVGNSGSFILGTNSLVTAKHFFDLTDNISIGNSTVIGGLFSQFWTHGFDIYRNGIQAPIHIKDHCYLAASCLVSLGVTIESCNQIGLGTVLARSITSTNGFWVSNNLIRKNDVKDISQSNGYALDETYPENRFYQKTREK